MRRNSLTATALFALALSLGAAEVAPPAHATAPPAPTASCVDGNFFDGLDTRYSAAYCRDALNAAGYSATAYGNTQANDVAARLGSDGVFAHAGHALVVGSGNYSTAIASAFAGPTATTALSTGLLGDPTAADFQGPAQVCNAGGSCRSVKLVNIPYESEMQKFNLAIFQSCNSARDGVQGYTSLMTVAADTGKVGTAVGFVDEVAWITNAPGDNLAGDGFARRFWGDLRSGRTYGSALVDAANVGGSQYGYLSYRMRHASNAPTALRPASYYVP